MTFLPIVGRELRVAARRLSTYWTRVAMAAGATAIGAIILLFSLNVPAQKIGYFIFIGLSGLSMVFCLFYGRQATADSLSAEKREGTLGLLFLTDLKGHDVVLGKLAATSLGGFYGLMAIFPVLSIPLLMGGITAGEFWRIALVLVNTFLFSLSVGMLASALCWDARKAVASNFLLLLVITGIPPAIAFALAAAKQTPVITELLLPCPVYGFYLALAGPYAANWQGFWLSIALTHQLTWLMLSLASRITPRRWQDRPAEDARGRWKARWRRLSFGGAAGQKAFRALALDKNAFYWLAARARLKPAHVWIFLGCVGLWWLVGWATSGRQWLDPVVYVLTALMINATFKIWFMIEAGQTLAEEQQGGTLELLLSTPLSPRELLHGQWIALRRQFGRPLLAVLVLELCLLLVCRRRPDTSGVVPVWIAGMAMLVVDMVAGAWVAMWLALSAKKPHYATLGAVIKILVVPWLLIGAIAGLLGIWFALGVGRSWDPTWRFYLTLWVCFGLVADLAFGLSARAKLQRALRQYAFRDPAAPEKHFGFRPAPSGKRSSEVKSAPKARKAIIWRPDWRPLRRKLIFVLIGSGLTILILWLLGAFPSRTRYPEPVLVRLNRADAPVRIVAAAQRILFILPDNSLWVWGNPFAQSNSPLPLRFDTNCNWVKVVGSYNRLLGLRTDGTIWEWPRSTASLLNPPTRFHDDTNWQDIAVFTSGMYAAGIRTDGTLWEWGNRSPMLGRRPGRSNEPTQVGTDTNWAALAGDLASMMGLRKDGSLWVWGMVYAFSGPNRIARQTSVPDPTRLCLETNWTGFLPGYPMLLQTASGQAWELSGTAPGPQAPAVAVSRLISSNAPTGRFATAYGGERKMYLIKPDGTLWESPCPTDATSVEQWRQVGQRKDWVSLFAAGPTAFGLTADGTLWAWGYDPSQIAKANFAATFKLIRVRLSAAFGGTPATLSRLQSPVFQKDPRPLLRLVKPGVENQP